MNSKFHVIELEQLLVYIVYGSTEYNFSFIMRDDYKHSWCDFEMKIFTTKNSSYFKFR